jgi:cell division protein FtsB
LALTRKDVFKFSAFALLFLSLMALWLGFGERGFIHLYRMDKERQEYVEKIEKLEQEKRELLKEINRLLTDKGYIESQGRRELGLVREGEVLYRFKTERDSKDTEKP